MTASSRKQDAEIYRDGRAWRKRSGIDEARELRIVKDWIDGMTIAALAEGCGVDNTTISRVLKKHNAKRPGGSTRKAPSAIGAELEAKVVSLLREGLPHAAIRVECEKISTENIRIIAARHGLERGRGGCAGQSKNMPPMLVGRGDKP